MTARVQVTITCDEPGCTSGYVFTKGDAGGLNVSTALDTLARRHGWQTGTTKSPQKCPKHRGRHPKAHEFVEDDRSGSCRAPLSVGPYPSLCYKPREHYVHAEGPVTS